MRFLNIASVFLMAVFGSYANAIVTEVNFGFNANEYSYGERAVLIAHTNVGAITSDMQLYVSSTLNGIETHVTTLGKSTAATLTEVLNQQGLNTWTLEVFIENRKLADKLNAAMLRYQIRNEEIKETLDKIENPRLAGIAPSGVIPPWGGGGGHGGMDPSTEVEAKLRNERETNNKIIDQLDNAIWNNRKFLTSASYQFNVVSKKMHGKAGNLISISPSHAQSIFEVNERAFFDINIKSELYDANGSLEVKAMCNDSLNEVTFINHVVSKTAHTCESNLLTTEDIGQHLLNVDLWVRPERMSNSLKDAVLAAYGDVKFFDGLVANTNDQALKTYYQSKSDRMTILANTIAGIRDNLWSILSSTNTPFTVKSSN